MPRVFDTGLTFAELGALPGTRAAWDAYCAQCADGSQPRDRWLRHTKQARGVLESPRVAGERVLFGCELQILPQAFVGVRHAMHEPYKVWRAETARALHADYRRTQAAGAVDRSKDAPAKTVYSAAWRGQLGTLRSKIEAGESPDAPQANGSGMTPLSAAAGEGHTDVVGLLLAKGANANATKSNGKTPLLVATDNQHVAVMELLLQHGASVGHADKHGATSLMLAADVSDNREALKLLIRTKASPPPSLAPQTRTHARTHARTTHPAPPAPCPRCLRTRLA